MYLEKFSQDEEQILLSYFTNVDLPVFVLINLPEVVKGALFARYSRTGKSLRRLFLDEFADDVDNSLELGTQFTNRSSKLYDKVFVEFGDDSVAQLGGAHLAIEGASNILTKIIERGRLASYLEQSTRYINYGDVLPNGEYRYRYDSDLLNSPVGAQYINNMNKIFEDYNILVSKTEDWLIKNNAIDGTIEDQKRGARTLALDLSRGVLPSGTLSNLGMFATGQTYEYLIMRMRASNLPEARQYAQLMLRELNKVIPDFLKRIDKENRGIPWSKYFETNNIAMAKSLENFDQLVKQETESSYVRLLEYTPEDELEIIAYMCYEYSAKNLEEIKHSIHVLSDSQRLDIINSYIGDRQNRRWRPGRALEHAQYTFEILSDYGAFRDLQRHRMLTIEWQPPTPLHGYVVPKIITDAGLSDFYYQVMERSKTLYNLLCNAGFPEQARYAVALGYNMRYLMTFNAREAMHIIELRSQPQGHPVYRQIVQEMHRQISQKHPILAKTMKFVDYGNTGFHK